MLCQGKLTQLELLYCGIISNKGLSTVVLICSDFTVSHTITKLMQHFMVVKVPKKKKNFK